MKKILSAASIILSACVLMSSTASAAVAYRASDVRNFSNYLLGGQLGNTSSDYKFDLDESGNTDVYDMILLRKYFNHSGNFIESVFKADEENVRLIGRTLYDENDVQWLVQSGAAAEFTVTGRAASITICGDSYTKNSDEHCPRYAILVDGEIIVDAQLNKTSDTVELFSGTESRTADVKVIHLSEANNGAVGVGGITVDSDVPQPVYPTFDKKMSIEFIGDSITCAYGVEGKDQYENFKTSTENFMKSYAYLTAQLLDADYSAVSYSGYGIISGYTSSDNKNTDSLVPDCYEFIGKSKEYAQKWDFSSHKYDVVVINLGTNDDTYISKDFESRSVEYTEKYTEFLKAVRKHNPDAYIICTLGTMGCTELYPCIEQAVADYKADTKDNRIMSYQSVTHTQSDGFGSDWHPSEKTQLNSAYVLADKICQALGMESSQIGLNVAADAQYSTKTADGANMSDYFSDWDGSYHITTVSGGKDISSIQSFLSPIGLKKGGEYELSFQLETSDGVSVPFVLRDIKTGNIIYEDTFEGTGTKSPYEGSFTCPVDSEAELVFSFGGTDSLRVSLYELKLIKNA